MQAIILAAGMGKRLGALTRNNTKCMIQVNGVTLIERMMRQLDRLSPSLEKIVIVTGYEGEKLKTFLSRLDISTPVEYVDNPLYASTNNIYSLYLAKEHLLQDDTLLFESDLIFEDSVIDALLRHPYPSLALVAKFESWMDGTVVTLDEDDNIRQFIPGSKFSYKKKTEYFKTVNIYKFSREFSRTHYVPFLTAYSKALGNNEYYEQVLRVIALLDKPEIKALRLGGEAWYEIDDIQDLDIAASIFTPDREEHLRLMESRYGGYWRYPRIRDFCYLVNPYFPNKRLMSELKANFERLVREYPSGMRVNSLLAAKYFGISQEYICIGNGAAELFYLYAFVTRPKRVLLPVPAFSEYERAAHAAGAAVSYSPLEEREGFEPDLIFLAEEARRVEADCIVFGNPNNPTGTLVERARERLPLGTQLVVDESFLDFREDEARFTVRQERLENLFLVRSLTKFFAIPGLRLGFAIGSPALLARMEAAKDVWNVNVLAQAAGVAALADTAYQVKSRAFIAGEKARLAQALAALHGVTVFPPSVNFILVKLAPAERAERLVKYLRARHILVRDCQHYPGLAPGFLRLAVRTRAENEALLAAWRDFDRMDP